MNKPEGIGETAYRLLKAGATNEETLAEVLSVHPDAKTTMNSIRFYRTKMNNAAKTKVEVKSTQPVMTEEEARVAGQTLLRDALRNWRSNEQALLEVKGEYPTAGIALEDIRLARLELRRSGEIVPTAPEARRHQIGERWAADPVPPQHVLQK